jgi:hypothetical protein
MHRCSNDDGARASNKEDAVWKAMDERAPKSSEDRREAQWFGLHRVDGSRNLFKEFPSETFTLFFVPIIGSSNVGFRIRADDEIQT